jgi:hypothetical protein
MAQNDPATDSINYAGSIGIGIVEFDSMNFEEIEDGDLFWFSDNQNSNQNHAFRKIDDNTAVDTRNGFVAEKVDRLKVIYQKT